MKAHEVRALLFNRKLQGKPVDFSIPGVPELDNQLFMLELTARDMRLIDKMAIDAEGNKDPLKAQAAVVCRGLLLKETKERVFADNDIDAIAGNNEPDDGKPVDGFGLFVLRLLGDEIGKLSGLEPDAIEKAKQDFLLTHTVGSTTPSTETSAAVALV